MNLKIQETANGFIVIECGYGFGDQTNLQGGGVFPTCWVASDVSTLCSLVREIAPLKTYNEWKAMEQRKPKFEEPYKPIEFRDQELKVEFKEGK